MEEKEINYETAYKRALNKIAQLKEDRIAKKITKYCKGGKNE